MGDSNYGAMVVGFMYYNIFKGNYLSTVSIQEALEFWFSPRLIRHSGRHHTITIWNNHINEIGIFMSQEGSLVTLTFNL